MSKAGVGTFITENHELASSGLALFDQPIIDSSLLQGKFITIYPSSVLQDNGPFDFIIPSDGQDFTDLPFTRLEGCIEILNLAGATLTDTDINAFVNLLPQSLFKQIEVSVNNTQIADLSTPTYAFKSYIETVLTYPKDAKETALLLEHFNKDTIDKENIFTLLNSISFNKRNQFAKKGKIYFSMLLHIDFFHSTKLLLPGCEIKLKFIRNSDTFSLLGDTLQAKIKFHELKLMIRRVTVEPTIASKIEDAINKTPAIYPITQSKIKTFLIPKDVRQERISNIFRGVLPRSIIVGFVTTDAANGAINANPFKFEHFKLDHFQMYINGDPLLTEAFQPDFANLNFFREYRWFMDNLGWAHDKESNGVTMEEFKTNTFFLPFDLSPDLSNGATLSQLKEGSLDVLVSFNENLAQNVQMIVFATFNELLLIDKDRNVTLV
jgi:hypothetical protein